MKVKAFAENLTVHDEEEVRLLAFDEAAVYGVELAFPESDADPYRVDLTRVSREPNGLERSQRLTLHEYASHTEAEEAWREVSTALFENGPEAIAQHLPALAAQPADNPQFIVATYPPHAPFTGGEVSVSLLALTETGLAEARLGADLAQATASDLNKQLDAAIEEGGPATLLETATHFAREQGQLAADAPLFPPQATALLDHGAELAQHLPQPAWEVELNEHVSRLPPYVSAEYRVPGDQVGEVNTPVRLHLEGEARYGFEVSTPDDAGAVSLAAIKTFNSENLAQEVSVSTLLKTYTPEDAELDPRTDALSDARALIYEWGRDDLDHAMGSALLLAQENGFTGDKLFQQDPADPFNMPADARRLETIQAEREWERDAELFGKAGSRNPQPADLTHERYGVDPAIEPGGAGGAHMEESDLLSRLATPIGAFVDRHAGDYLLTDAAILPPGQRLAPPDEIEYQVLPLDSLPVDKEKPSVPAEYDPVRMKPIADDIPADHDADYAFEVRHIRAFDLDGELTDSYHVVEAVKSWHNPAILGGPDERLTLSLPLAAFDDKASAFETAEQLTAKWWAEGLQPAMQEATNMAVNHLHPNIMDVENGHLFGLGPPDPFRWNLLPKNGRLNYPIRMLSSIHLHSVPRTTAARLIPPPTTSHLRRGKPTLFKPAGLKP